jgi:hypothetical protein
MANYWTIAEDRLLYQDPPVEDVDAKAAELRNNSRRSHDDGEG